MKKLILSLLLLVPLFAGNNFVYAETSSTINPPTFASGKQGILPNSGETTGTGFKEFMITKFLPAIANVFITILWSISAIFIIIAGIFYLMSSGNSEMTKKAKDIIMWTIIGTGLASLSYALVKLLVGINFSLTP